MNRELPDDMSFERTSTARQVAAAIRERILLGDLPPGTPLREVQLASMLGVSRNTVREGVRDLVNEGLLRHNIHRGVSVSSLSPSEVREVFATRKVLEGAGIRSSRLVTKEQLKKLKGHVATVQRAASEHDFAATVEADFEFHRALVGLLGVDRIGRYHMSLLSELRLELYRLDREGLYDPIDWTKQHRQILELLREGKRAAAAQVLERHLDEAQSVLLAALETDAK